MDDSQISPLYFPTSSYQQHEISGFTVLIHELVLSHTEQAAQILEKITQQLHEFCELLHPIHIQKLKDIPVKIWIEWQSRQNGGAEFHVSQNWLIDHRYNPEKWKCIEISNTLNFLNWTHQPMMLLHELSHAYHFQVIMCEYPEVDVLLREVYQQAQEKGIYQSVQHAHGMCKKAYAMENYREFFAESCESFFGVNDFQPFTREELKEMDPDTYNLLLRIWGDRPVAQCAVMRKLEQEQKQQQQQQQQQQQEAVTKVEEKLRSGTGTVQVNTFFTNETASQVQLYWIDNNGEEIEFGVMKPQQKLGFQSCSTHVFCFRDQENKHKICHFVLSEDASQEYTVKHNEM